MSEERTRGSLNWKGIAAVLGGLAAVITAVAALLPTLDGSPDSSPESSPDSPPEVEVTVRDAERLASRWVAAVQSGDVETLVGMAAPPFYMDNEIRFSKTQIRQRYQEMLERASSEFEVTRLDARTVREFKDAGLMSEQRDRVLGSMRIEDDDFAVAVFIGDEAIALFFRQVDSSLEMAGFWD